MSVNDPAAAAASSGSSYPIQEAQVDLTKLNALSPEVISKQATVSFLCSSAPANDQLISLGLQINIGELRDSNAFSLISSGGGGVKV